jgi:hypothetical protein
VKCWSTPSISAANISPFAFLLDLDTDITAFRLVQETTAEVSIEIVPGPGYAPEMSGRIRERFLELVGEPLEVRVEIVPDIARAGGGKHHPIVSHVRH